MSMKKAKWFGLALFLLEAAAVLVFVINAHNTSTWHPVAPHPIVTPTTYGYPQNK